MKFRVKKSVLLFVSLTMSIPMLRSNDLLSQAKHIVPIVALGAVAAGSGIIAAVSGVAGIEGIALLQHEQEALSNRSHRGSLIASKWIVAYVTVCTCVASSLVCYLAVQSLVHRV